MAIIFFVEINVECNKIESLKVVKKQFFEIEKDGFYGTYYENPKGSDCVVIGLFGDDPNDFMAKCGAKWLHKNGVDFAAFPVNPRPGV